MIKAAEWLAPCPPHWRPRTLGSLVEVAGGMAPSVAHSDYWNEIFKSFELKQTASAQIDRRYFAYALYAISDYLVNNLEKIEPRLKAQRADAWRRIPVALPPVAEQRRIADFIEHKISTLDSLIDKKQALVPLFQEKRQAFIRQAVTRGLRAQTSQGAAVVLKESGIPGIGAVPSHWRIKRLKHLSLKQVAQYDREQSDFQSAGTDLFDASWLYHALMSQMGRFSAESV